MLSERNTQPRLVTEPTMKPTLAAPRHSSTPTCTRCIGCCPWLLTRDANSAVAALAGIRKRRIKNLRLKEAMRARNQKRHTRGMSLYDTTPPKQKRPAFAGRFLRIATD